MGDARPNAPGPLVLAAAGASAAAGLVHSAAAGTLILSPGKTMANVPDVAGPLTAWHDHQDLCWQGARVVARATGGVCPRGVLAATPPMLHVWLVDTPCGPFAGLEGHGTKGCRQSGH